MFKDGRSATVTSLTARPGDWALRVDMLGAPGVGKSTLLLTAAQRGVLKCVPGRQDGWLTFDAAARLAERSAEKSARMYDPRCVRKGLPGAIRAWARRLLMGIRTGREETSDIHELGRELIVGFLREHEAFFLAIVSLWFEPEMPLPPQSVRFAELLFWTTEWLFVLKYARGYRILADNARLTRGLAELLSKSEWTTQPRIAEGISRFCQSGTGPAGVVHMTAPPELVLERVKKREADCGGWRHPGHCGLCDDEIISYTKRRNEVNARAVQFLASLGTPVLTIDGSEPLERNVGLLEGFLRALERRGARDGPGGTVLGA